jgi:8-oxo-dGTP pyrophosphatase MutT (NUDIX family)
MDSLSFPITFPSNVSLDLLSKSPLIPRWASTISPQFRVDKVSLLSADPFGSRIGCCELEVSYTLNDHSHIERIILHGKAVMVVFLLRCTDTNELFTVLVQQPRIGCGRLMFEFPAGMADDSSDIAGVAAREIEEEVGISCAKEDLIPLSEMFNEEHPKTFINPSNYEQNTHSFLLVKRMKKVEVLEFEGRKCGVGQDEQIVLKVVEFADVIKWAYEPATLGVTLMVMELMEKGKIVV